jgi:hypothetical protein
MNPKNALFLAATLTAFVLATLFAVVNKVTTTPIEAAAAPAMENTATTAPTEVQPTDALAATAQTELGPMEAAKIAADSLGHTDVYSVETFTYKTQATFKVVFTSGDIVYVGMDRQIVDKGKVQAVVVSGPVVTTAPKKHKSNSDSSGSVQPPAAQPPAAQPPHEGGGGDD